MWVNQHGHIGGVWIMNPEGAVGPSTPCLLVILVQAAAEVRGVWGVCVCVGGVCHWGESTSQNPDSHEH